MKVLIYCECNGCDDSVTLKREANLKFLPRVEEEVDGMTVRKVSHSSKTGKTILFISNTESLAEFPDSSRPLGRSIIKKYGYKVCDYDEWWEAYFA